VEGEEEEVAGCYGGWGVKMWEIMRAWGCGLSVLGYVWIMYNG
jgi:hypothetical protein